MAIGTADERIAEPRDADSDRVRGPLPQTEVYGYLLTDASGVILQANPTAAALLHARLDFLVGKPLGLFVTEAYRGAFYERLARQRHLGRADSFETRLGWGRAQPSEVVVTVSIRESPDSRGLCYQWLLRDVGGTRRVELMLEAERQLLDSVISAAQAIILVLDAENRVVRSNPYLHEVSGHCAGELQGQVWYNLLLDQAHWHAVRRMVLDARLSGEARSAAVPLRSKTGSRRDIVWAARGLPGGLTGAAVLVGHDVTELQEAQRQALQTERLAAIGQIAAGLAHESRNALQRIQACLSMLALRSAEDRDVQDLVARAQKAQDDLHRLLEDVRSYAAELQAQPVATDLAVAWREAWADVASLRGQAPAELREDLAETDTTCGIDPFQMKRVFRNLFENALAAASDPVRVTIRCRPTALGGAAALEVSVRDNGPGFPPRMAHRLFEPFFTTKTHGTGLGLAICRRIVLAHGGRIEAGAEGPGAEVLLTLPRRMP
jgi:PAS domain S-box-containing protein